MGILQNNVLRLAMKKKIKNKIKYRRSKYDKKAEVR